MTAHEQDRALTAVRRVRSARETDSRIGLQHALSTLCEREAEEARAQQRLAEAPLFAAGSTSEFAAHVVHVSNLAQDSRRTGAAAESSRTVAGEATRRWQADTTAVRVVELLLERRAAERTAERARREARELDDLAAQGWLRTSAAEAARLAQAAQVAQVSQIAHATRWGVAR
ncbi:MAG: hypothetical protein ACXVWU_01105 [Nocardioides sp.]